MAVTKVPLEIEVGDILGSTRSIFMRGWAMSPASVDPVMASLVYCLAGGGCSTAYFDLEVTGHDDYNMAEYLVERGVVVVAFDHPGIGNSDSIPDMFAATPSLVARCHDRALRVVQDKLKAGRLVPTLSSPAQPLVVGLGHSMGGLITVVQQGLLRSFDALVVLGHSGSGLPEVLTEAELSLCVEEADLLAVEEQIVELARTRFVEPSEVPRKRPVRGEFFADDVPKAVQGAFAHHATPLMFTCGLAAMIPNLADAQLARIDVPVFLGFGDQDLADNRFDAVSRYRNVTDATLFLLQQSGHCHNQASGRARLWERILRWIENVNAGRWSDLDRPNVPQTSR